MMKIAPALALLTLLACSPDKSVCVPGETQRCLCPNLDDGAQSCEADGLSWSDCACAAGADTGTSPQDTGSSDTDSSDAGYAVFLTYCAACHGTDGRGGSGPDLRREVPEMSDTELREIIAEGEDEMPGFDLSTEQMSTLIAWLRESFGREEEQEEEEDD